MLEKSAELLAIGLSGESVEESTLIGGRAVHDEPEENCHVAADHDIELVGRREVLGVDLREARQGTLATWTAASADTSAFTRTVEIEHYET